MCFIRSFTVIVLNKLHISTLNPLILVCLFHEMAQVVEMPILPMPQWHKKPGYLQTCYWPSYLRTFQFQQSKGWGKLMLIISYVLSYSCSHWLTHEAWWHTSLANLVIIGAGNGYLSSFVRDSHVGCVLYNGRDNHYQIRLWIQIMPNIRVLSNHERALLAHPCTFGEKIARFGISWF